MSLNIDPTDPTTVAVIVERLKSLHETVVEMKDDMGKRLDILEGKVEHLIGIKNRGVGALWAVTKGGAIVAFVLMAFSKLRGWING